MRIISGKARGTKINTIESDSTRPTLDRVKESLFNILQTKIIDAVVLDLFAGSGALGIESLSRGAKKAYFCDKNPEAIKVIKQNLEKTHLSLDAKVYNLDYAKFIQKLGSMELKDYFDIIFIDPPYKMDLAIKSVELIERTNILKGNGLIIIETDEINRDMNEIEKLIQSGSQLEIIDRRKYGRANLVFINKKD